MEQSTESSVTRIFWSCMDFLAIAMLTNVPIRTERCVGNTTARQAVDALTRMSAYPFHDFSAPTVAYPTTSTPVGAPGCNRSMHNGRYIPEDDIRRERREGKGSPVNRV